MKKKLLLTAIAATVFATSALGIAACSPADSGDTSAPGAHTVTFDANGGQFPTSVTTPLTLTTGEDGKLAALPTEAQQPTYTDHTFLGWTLTKTSSTNITVESIFYADTTVYAHWRDDSTPGTDPGTDPGNTPGQTVTYDITFHATNGALAGKWGDDATKVVKTGTDGKIAAANLPIAPTLTGYTLDEWNTKNDGTGDTVDASHVFSANGDVWAIWKKNDNQGGGGDDPDNPEIPDNPGDTYPEGDGGIEGATVSETLKLFVGTTEHNVYVNPSKEDYEASSEYIDSVALHNGDVITLKNGAGEAVQFRYKGDGVKVDSYTLRVEPQKPVNIYIKTYTDNNTYELELYDKYNKVNYDKDGKLVSSTPDPDDPDTPTTGEAAEAAAASATYTIGTGEAVALTNDYANINKQQNATQDRQFVLKEVEIAANTKITFAVTDAVAGHNLAKIAIESGAQGLVETGDVNQAYVTTDAKGGKYTIYLKHYTGAANDGKWVIWSTRIDEEEIAQERTEALAASATVKVGAATAVAMTNNYDAINKVDYATRDREFTATVTVAANETITFAVTDAVAGHAVSAMWVDGNCKGLAGAGHDVTGASVKVGKKAGELTITFCHYTGEDNNNKWVLYTTFVSDGTPEVVEAKDVYIRGTINGTEDWTTGLKMEQISAADTENLEDQYKLTVTLKAGDSFKIYCADVTGSGNGNGPGWSNYVDNTVATNKPTGGSNITVNAGVDGSYTIYFKIWQDGGTSIAIAAATA